MKWLAKLNEKGLQESSITNKKLRANINEYKDVKEELDSLEEKRDIVDEDDIDEFNSDLDTLKQELNKLGDELEIGIDKYLVARVNNVEKVKKMQQAKQLKKAANGSVVEPTPIVPIVEPIVEPKPIEEEPKEEKKAGIGSWVLGGLLLLVGGTAAISYFKNNK
jgi:phosphoglycerate-specific signal transduction histidine kinase